MPGRKAARLLVGLSAAIAMLGMAVSAEAFLRNAIWSNIKRSGSNGLGMQSAWFLAIGGGPDTRYALMSRTPL